MGDAIKSEGHLATERPRERPFVPNAEGRSFLFGRLGVGAPASAKQGHLGDPSAGGAWSNHSRVARPSHPGGMPCGSGAAEVVHATADAQDFRLRTRPLKNRTVSRGGAHFASTTRSDKCCAPLRPG